jgi:hypothetical protein
MDLEDALKAELKEAKLGMDEKCTALEKVEGLVKAKDKEITDLKAIKSASLLSWKTWLQPNCVKGIIQKHGVLDLLVAVERSGK